jgi:hypothetical protein
MVWEAVATPLTVLPTVSDQLRVQTAGAPFGEQVVRKAKKMTNKDSGLYKVSPKVGGTCNEIRFCPY